MTRAAERLNISQPSLSAAIQQLERQLGVELLARMGRRIEITPAGEMLRERGRVLLEQAESTVDAVRERHQAGAGRLALGVSPTARSESRSTCSLPVPPRSRRSCSTRPRTPPAPTSRRGARSARSRDHLLRARPTGRRRARAATRRAGGGAPSERAPPCGPVELRPGDLAEETILVGATDDSRGSAIASCRLSALLVSPHGRLRIRIPTSGSRRSARGSASLSTQGALSQHISSDPRS